MGVARWDLNDPNAVPEALDARAAGRLRAYPNPFRERTALSFRSPRESRARVDVFDVAGRHVRSLFQGRLRVGSNGFSWDGRDGNARVVPGGVYFVSIQSEDGETHCKVVLMH